MPDEPRLWPLDPLWDTPVKVQNESEGRPESTRSSSDMGHTPPA